MFIYMFKKKKKGGDKDSEIWSKWLQDIEYS